MITSRQQNIVQNQNIVIKNLSFEKVEKFKYLGVTVTNINDIPEEIKRRTWKLHLIIHLRKFCRPACFPLYDCVYCCIV